VGGACGLLQGLTPVRVHGGVTATHNKCGTLLKQQQVKSNYLDAWKVNEQAAATTQV
jgi:hypothetical protein